MLENCIFEAKMNYLVLASHVTVLTDKYDNSKCKIMLNLKLKLWQIKAEPWSSDGIISYVSCCTPLEDSIIFFEICLWITPCAEK